MQIWKEQNFDYIDSCEAQHEKILQRHVSEDAGKKVTYKIIP